MQALWRRLPKITQGFGRPACEVYVPISCQLPPSPRLPASAEAGAWSPFRWVCSMGRGEECAMRDACNAAQQARRKGRDAGCKGRSAGGRPPQCSRRKARCAAHPCVARSWRSVRSPAATSAVTCGAEIQTVVSVPPPCPAPHQGLRLDKTP